MLLAPAGGLELGEVGRDLGLAEGVEPHAELAARLDLLVLPEDLYQRPRGVCGQEREDGAARARVSGGAVSETRAGARRNRRFASKCVCVEGEGLRGLSLWTLSGANWWRRPPRSNRAEAAEGPRGAGGTGGQLQVHRLVEVAVSLAREVSAALLSML